MRVKTWENGEKYIFHCSWGIAEDCEDKNTTREDIEKCAIEYEINSISSGLCEKCAAVLNAEWDEKGI